MTVRARPLHCKFETLRLATVSMLSRHPYHRFGCATNEQLTARGLGRTGFINRPTVLFSDFREV